MRLLGRRLRHPGGGPGRQVRTLCRKLHLEEGDRLVDIGCGWGGMLSYAARAYGVDGVGYTLSTEQAAYANDRLRAEGLYPDVRVELQDYREATGQFDKFVSIGMFEHVGKEYYRTFFDKVAELLVPGGIGVLHTIGSDVVGPVNDPGRRRTSSPAATSPPWRRLPSPWACVAW